MRVWLGKFLCIIAALGVSDSYLVVAQAWAWAAMLHDRAPVEGVTEALGSTFGGDAPCLMCFVIQEEQKEKEQEPPVPETKPTMDYSLASMGWVIVPRPQLGSYVRRGNEISERMPLGLDSPPSPPPRV